MNKLAVELGVAWRTIYRWERGISAPSAGNLVALWRYLQRSQPRLKVEDILERSA